MDTSELMVLDGRIRVPYRWSVGETGSHFFTTLRDEKVIQATKCEDCEAVYLPPRKTCPTCFTDCASWVAVGPGGTVMDATVVRVERQLNPLPVPFAYATIRIDGATTSMLHVVAGPGVENIAHGQHVRPIFRSERRGEVFDIEYFELLTAES